MQGMNGLNQDQRTLERLKGIFIDARAAEIAAGSPTARTAQEEYLEYLAVMAAVGLREGWEVPLCEG